MSRKFSVAPHRPAFEPLEPRWLLSAVDPSAELNSLKLGWDAGASTSAAVTRPLGDATPAGTTFRIDEQFGGTWWDANKTINDTQDNLMCWAAAASNALEWTGWGSVPGIATSQQIFQYYQDHWTDNGGMMEFAWRWWFSGTNTTQGWSGWSQVDVAGGGFWPAASFAGYFHDQENPAQAMTAIDQWSRAGDSVTLGLYGPGGHAITCWGFNVDPANPTNYYGIWVTDSDDSESSDNPPAQLRYYEVAQSGGKWYLQDYYGSNAWYIGSVEALAPRTVGASLTISGLPDQTLAKNTTRPAAVYLPSYASASGAPGAALSYSIVGNTDPSAGVSLVAGVTLSFAPTAEWTGYSDVTVQVTDGVHTATDTFRVTVTNPTVSLAGSLSAIVLTNPTGPLNYNLIQLQVRNTGSGTASGFSTMQLWASKDGVLDGSDDFKLADIRPYVYLPAGATGYYYFSYIVPDTVPAGTYNLVGVIDSSSDFSSANTSGNQTSIANVLVMQNPDLTVGIPLVVLPLTTPGSWGWTLLRVNNTGSAWAWGQADIQVWASTDGVLGNGAGDVLLTTLSNYWIVLPPGAAGYYAAVFQLPQSMASGSYSIMAVVNSSDTLAETDLTNNTATLPKSYSLAGVHTAGVQGAVTPRSPAPAIVNATASHVTPAPGVTPTMRTVSVAGLSSIGSQTHAAAESPVAGATPRWFLAGHLPPSHSVFETLAGCDVFALQP